jgi:glycosyltransferase involved in cell wall biosynthesis
VVNVSVVIPAYNAERVLARAIRSALAQTLRPLEIIVVDDGSTDGTYDVAASFGPEVTVFRQKNTGPSGARNFGIENAKGEWIAFLDSDDQWKPNKLEAQLPLLSKPSVALVHSRPGMHDGEVLPDQFTFETLWKRNYIFTSTAIIRRSVINSVGGFHTGLMTSEDYHLWLRVAHGGHLIVGSSEDLCVYSPEDGSLSGDADRMLKGELASLDLLAAQLGLSKEMVEKKRAAVFTFYGEDFLHSRNMGRARRVFAAALKREPTARRLKLFATSCLPGWLLNAGRKIKQLGPQQG